MKIHFDRPIRVGDVRLAVGDYHVTVEEASQQIVLATSTGVFKVPATKRGSKILVTKPSVQLRQVVGEPRRLLIVRTAPAFEWVISLEDVVDSEN